ncbi:MAG TPA: sigma factor G inhibitor Gin [Clostridia bacterium]|nr:sigma factor G inhibitor Gin [Clostridia bacterium]
MDEKLRCHICNNIGDEGVILLNRYICRGCELGLVGASVGELEYEKFRRGIRDIWKDFNRKYDNKSISI